MWINNDAASEKDPIDKRRGKLWKIILPEGQAHR